jgi:nicotinamidase/pyrazinamidase
MRNGGRSALIVVDVQNDFLPPGALAIPNGDAVVGVLNRYLAYAEGRRWPVFAVRDWHPAAHCSFHPQGGAWPVHCVAGTPGAAFAPGLHLPRDVAVISKGLEAERDAYSGFEGTDLDERLRALCVSRLLIGGLAAEYCVLNTVRDARALGYDVWLLRDAIRPVHPSAGARAEREMLRLGAVPIDASALGDSLRSENRESYTLV